MQTVANKLVNKIAILLFLLSTVGLWEGYAQQDAASFSVDVISVREDAGHTSRLDVYTAVPHAGLRFLKSGDVFSARYEVSTLVFDVDDNNRKRQMVERVSWVEEVMAGQFASTHSAQQKAFSTQSIPLEPGKYHLEIQLKDLASEEVFEKSLLAEVRDLSGSLSMSDLILINDFDVASQTIAPLVNDQVDINKPDFKIFYELYSDAGEDVIIRREVVRTVHSRGLPFLRWFFGRRQSDEEAGEIAFESEQPLTLRAGRNPVALTLPVAGYDAGEYRVRVIAQNMAGEPISIAERAVTMNWIGESEFQGRDIDMAIAQLRFTANSKEIKRIQSGKTKEERTRLFFEFWQKRDPTPGTPENERMAEYFVRVDYANRHYAGQNNGWETDRGEIFISYGKPEEIVANRGLDIDQPYEIWHYPRVGKQFTFIANKNGDFKLNIPTWNKRRPIR